MDRLGMLAGELSSVFIFHDELQSFASGGVLHLCDIMVLLHIDANNACHAALLANVLGVTRPKISRSLKRLVKAGLVEEAISQADHRISLYRLSNRGEHVVFEIKKKFGAQKTAQHFREYCALQHGARAAEQAFDVSHFSESAVRILLVLGEAGSPQVGLSQAEICEATHLAQNRVSAALDVLDEKGFVRKRLAAHDRRLQVVSLSAKGKKLRSTLLLSLEEL